MTIKTIQTLINIGSSKGVTLPAKDLKYAGIKTGDELEVIVRKRNDLGDAETSEVLKAAKKILNDYKQDFDNLSKR
ncbi:MAG: AbrB/MazE/SpoVT family DNA-binding domain-containing protein [Candidatus Saccharibacteria bacterium]|nr:AbrB/MazE/SpoVT family DNA-binding domain-containing protein [Candidatus Saccharibacteria bacterium]